MPSTLALGLLTAVSASQVIASEQDTVQDMSDPLAVYTQAGAGYSDKGLNLKFGQTYDTGSDTTMGMNVLEIKGIAGDAVGFRDNNKALYSGVDDSIDSLRFRNFSVDLTNGRGAQIDLNYNFDTNQGSASYSFIQALPKFGPVNLYPLAGLGVAAGEPLTDKDRSDADELHQRYDIHGTFYVAGMYTKVEITDAIWLNYNPMYLGTISGSEAYKHGAFYGDDSVFTHEFAVSYQVNPRFNLRYFANWDEEVRFENGDHRIEFNYQF
ncbi:hypothetical protein J4N42_21910 [Vibrio sp. SCSIO 43135]|nr:hypothetical protein J4N42_21910 [Vibrio sp. SCSIO 43135]